MKLICTQDNFRRAIYNCERVVAKKNTLPILNNILLETKKGGLSFSATNLEIGISTKIGAKIEKEGQITIPARLLSGFSANLPSGENITLETIEDKLKIKSGTNKTIIKGMPANDFPLIPDKKAEVLIELPSFDLRNIFSKIIPSVALNEARQELTGINMILKEKEIFFAATDSFRLSECKLKMEEKNINKDNYGLFIAKNNNLIIPAATLLELNRIIPGEKEVGVKITIEESQIFFELDGIRLVSRLINGKFPAYEHIMPKNYATRLVGEKQALQNAIKLASIFSSGGASEITLKIDVGANKVIVLSSGAETGENSTELKFDITGPSQEVVLNAKYFLDGINAASSSQVAILFNSPSTPAAIKEIDVKTGEVLEDFTYIVMPVKN